MYDVLAGGYLIFFFKWRSSENDRPASHQVRNKASAGAGSGSAVAERCAEGKFWRSAHWPPNAVRPVSCSVTKRSASDTKTVTVHIDSTRPSGIAGGGRSGGQSSQEQNTAPAPGVACGSCK